MYARYWFRYVAKAGVGAALLRLLRVCQAVLLWVTPGALGSVWLFNGRTGELPEKAIVPPLREPPYAPPYGGSVWCFR